MKTVCSTSMPLVREAFETLGDVVIRDGRAIGPADVRDAELLAIRSTTRVDRGLLEGSAVRFVGTATIGTDHMDLPYLEQAGIRWCFAPGCNANSVSEYVTAALLCLAGRRGLCLEGKTLGVIGVGNVGRLVVEKAHTLGLRVLANDPPRARREGLAGFVELQTVLAESDIVTFHVPLTREGPDATAHMAGRALFERLKPGCIFLNAARGAVVDTDALLFALDRGIVAHAVIDTWEGEPRYRVALLDRVDLGTPHIAGHSFEGKVMGTVMVYREACAFLGRPAVWTPDDLLPAPQVPDVRVDAAGRGDEEVLRELVRQVYDIEGDDHRLRACREGPERCAAHFDALRRHYPERREFRFTRVHLRNASETLAHKVAGLGFKLSGRQG